MLPLSSSAAVVFFEHPLGRITQEAEGFIRLQWLAGLRDTAAVRAIFEQLTRTCQRTACPRLLIDERLAEPFAEDAKSWLLEHGLPGLCQPSGYAQVAVISATDVYARLSAVSARAESQRLGLPFRAFASEAEARTWLNLR
jgi:hypothetical protein